MQNNFEIKISNGREKIDEVFVLIEASKMTLNEGFIKYDAKTYWGKRLKGLIEEGIKKEIKDFYCPIMDPSIVNGKICYCKGMQPATEEYGQTYQWWRKAATEFYPERMSRLGNKFEYAIFLGVLIKKLIHEKGWDLEKAWDTICYDFKKMEVDKSRLLTGSKEFCGFYDLDCSFKMLEEDNEEHFQYRGCHYWEKANYPLAYITRQFDQDIDGDQGVGWIVLS